MGSYDRWVMKTSFLSTLPARGATHLAHTGGAPAEDFYPRSPRGERRRGLARRRGLKGISIHAPREGSDLDAVGEVDGGRGDFYPRSPRGERPRLSTTSTVLCYFYPRSPRGERPLLMYHDKDGWFYFYPRSPRGERPVQDPLAGNGQYFYPRSPRGERPRPAGISELPQDFYPRSPRGERRE